MHVLLGLGTLLGMLRLKEKKKEGEKGGKFTENAADNNAKHGLHIPMSKTVKYIYISYEK